MLGKEERVAEDPEIQRQGTVLSFSFRKKKELHEGSEVDWLLFGRNFIWTRRNRNCATSRIDRFLLSMEWDEELKYIKKSTLLRISSNHTPLLLQCGDSEKRNSYFKVENMWIEVGSFKDMIGLVEHTCSLRKSGKNISYLFNVRISMTSYNSNFILQFSNERYNSCDLKISWVTFDLGWFMLMMILMLIWII